MSEQVKTADDWMKKLWDADGWDEMHDIVKMVMDTSRAEGMREAAEISGRVFDDPGWHGFYQLAGEGIKKEILSAIERTK